jgi:hypothetical protein
VVVLCRSEPQIRPGPSFLSPRTACSEGSKTCRAIYGALELPNALKCKIELGVCDHWTFVILFLNDGSHEWQLALAPRKRFDHLAYVLLDKAECRDKAENQ